MAYADVTVVVNGAVEDQIEFTDETLLSEFISNAEEDAQGHGYPTEVYILRHSEDVECECHQYVTDGRPAYEWNTGS